MSISELYTGGEYQQRNPDWHVADSAWKCDQVEALLGHAPDPGSVCEVGCGAGEILRQLHDRRPAIERLVGYEVAEAPYRMALDRRTDRLAFELGDAAEDPERFDLMLIMDVIEHVPDPIGFLAGLRFKARETLVHIPLDLSAQSVVRPGKLPAVRAKVGHIHYFTLETALATLTDAGYTVTGHRLTRSFDLPPGSLKARAILWPRRVLPPLLTARLLGGYSVLVAAANR